MLDTTTMTYTENQVVVIEDGVIVDVADSYTGDADVDIDAAGRFVLPGLIDGHVHFRLATLDFRALVQWSEVQFGINMARLAAETVERGFTTVRDLGGDVNGLMRSIADGHARGPRIVRAGLMLTQTGGHGDIRSGEIEVASCGCVLDSSVMSIVADGPDAVRKAARHLLRDGSDFIKIHVSGGVASPADPLESVQYTTEEIRIIVTEAQHRGTYVSAHAYTSEAIAMAVDAGVHCIEHGNLMDDTDRSADRRRRCRRRAHPRHVPGDGRHRPPTRPAGGQPRQELRRARLRVGVTRANAPCRRHARLRHRPDR